MNAQFDHFVRPSRSDYEAYLETMGFSGNHIQEILPPDDVDINSVINKPDQTKLALIGLILSFIVIIIFQYAWYLFEEYLIADRPYVYFQSLRYVDYLRLSVDGRSFFNIWSPIPWNQMIAWILSGITAIMFFMFACYLYWRRDPEREWQDARSELLHSISKPGMDSFVRFCLKNALTMESPDSILLRMNNAGRNLYLKLAVIFAMLTAIYTAYVFPSYVLILRNGMVEYGENWSMHKQRIALASLNASFGCKMPKALGINFHRNYLVLDLSLPNQKVVHLGWLLPPVENAEEKEFWGEYIGDLEWFYRHLKNGTSTLAKSEITDDCMSHIHAFAEKDSSTYKLFTEILDIKK